MQDAPKAHSIQRVAELIGSGRDAVYQAIRSGRLKAKKFGSRTIVLDADLTEFLQSLPDLELSSSGEQPEEQRTPIRSRGGGRRHTP